MKINLLKRLLKKTYDNSLTKRLTEVSSDVYIQIFEKDRIANLNIDDVIEANWQASKNVFIGFVGQPADQDDTLMYCYKQINKSGTSTRNFLMAQNFVERLGFRLVAVEVPSTDRYKVMVTPGTEIARYLTAKALEEKYHGVNELYSKIR